MEKWQLGNGLTVISEQLSNQKTISIGLFIKVGSQDENYSYNGITHLTEHVVTSEFLENCKKLGAVVNAITTKEYICIFVKVIDKYFEKAISYLFHVTLYLEKNNNKLEQCKNIVMNEINEYNNNIENVLDQELFELHYGKDSLAYPIMGNTNNIKGFSIDDIKNHYRNFFNPTNAVLSIVGGIDIDIITKIVNPLFINWENTYTQKTTKYEKKVLIKGGFKNINNNINNNSSLCLCFNGVRKKSKYKSAMLVASNILNNALYKVIREKYGISYLAYCSPMFFVRSGILYVRIDTNNKYINEAYNKFKEIIQYISDNEIHHNDLSVAKKNIINKYIFNHETTSSKMTHYGQSILFNIKSVLDEEVINDIEKVSARDVISVFRKCFSGKTSIITFGKKSMVDNASLF
ncbi:M16 family metallopeptidase [Natronospora cellulosivora (SeqCode)]